jgi:Mg/Co/Ni transporter MgtE
MFNSNNIENSTKTSQKFPENYISLLEQMNSEERINWLKQKPEYFIKNLLDNWIYINNISDKKTPDDLVKKYTNEDFLIFISKMKKKEFVKFLKKLPEETLKNLLDDWYPEK